MELPTITASSYVSSAVDARALGLGLGLERRAQGADHFINQLAAPAVAHQVAQQAQKPEIKPMSTARIVKVFIADPNDNLPLDKRVLHKGDETLTDLTDQELFYEVPIAELLAKHNEYRKTVVDKKQAEKFGRDICLEPARIRDLRMVVVTVAQF